MLVLKRRRDQAVRIGPDVRVQVLEISDEWVKLGITAPPELAIARDINVQDGAEDNASKAIRSSGNDGLPRPPAK